MQTPQFYYIYQSNHHDFVRFFGHTFVDIQIHVVSSMQAKDTTNRPEPIGCDIIVDGRNMNGLFP